MARTLSDALIIAMIEASTRLAYTRIRAELDSSPTDADRESKDTDQASKDSAAQAKDTAAQAKDAVPDVKDANGTHADAGRAEAPSAEKVGDDWVTIYKRMEEVVRESAEQETKSVGFTVR